MRRSIFVAFLVVSAFFPAISHAEPIRLEFRATVTDIIQDQIGLGPNYGIQVGTELIALMSWDSDWFQYTDPASDSYTRHFPEPFFSVFMQIGSATIDYVVDSVDRQSTQLLIRGDNAIHLSSIPYPEFVDIILPLAGSFNSLFDFTQSFDQSLWTTGTIRVIQDVQSFRHFVYYASISEIKQVPEPATWATICLFVAAVFWRHRASAFQL